jgi:hypothetical protein
MTDSLPEQMRDTRSDATPDGAYRLTHDVGAEEELARLRSAAQLPGLPGSLPPGVGPAVSFRPAARPYSEGKRLFYGLVWTGWTLLLAIAGCSLLPHGSTIFSGLLAFALAIITGRYAYRIWTWQAKRLIFFIIW